MTSAAFPPGLDPSRMPTHLALPWMEYWSEEHPRIRLHWMTDTAEIAVRWVSAMALAEVAQANGGRVSEDLARNIRDDIERPTLGRWLKILQALDSSLPKVPALATGIRDAYRSTFESPFAAERDDGPGGGIETSLLVLRNALAHGGGLPRTRAAELLALHRERFEGLLRSVVGAMEGLRVVAVDGERCLLLRGPRPEPTARPAQLPPTVSGLFLAGERTCMPLAPIALFAPVRIVGRQGTWETRDPEPAAQIYVRATPTRLAYNALGRNQTQAESGDVAGFRELFRLDDPAATGLDPVKRGFAWDDFLVEARGLAEDLVGRKAEIEKAKSWMKGRDARSEGVGRIAWIGGGPGLGKSMLVAKLASEASNARLDRQGVFYHRFRAGDPRCSKRAFLQLLLSALSHWPPLRAAIPAQTPRGEENERKLLFDVTTCLRELEGLPAPRPGAPPPRFLIFVDGLDEVVSDPPELPDLIRALALPGTLFVLAGRPERGLGAASFGPGCESLFPQDGLPAMSPDDLRAMLLQGLGGSKYPLLRRDRDEGELVKNAFVERVVRCARGLPLYVYLLLEDLRAGALTVSDEDRLPDGLVRYYDALMGDAGLSDTARDLPLLICILGRTLEPLDADALAILFAGGPEDAADFRERAEQVVRAGRALIRTASTPLGTLGSSLYHKSLRDHVRAAPILAGVFKEAGRSLERATSWRSALLAAGGSSRSLAGYVARHGIHHLLEAGKIERALAFAVELLNSGGDDPNCSLETVEESLVAIAAALATAKADAVRRIEVRSLAPVLAHVYDYEALQGALDAVLEAHATESEQILSTVLDAENWTASFSLSFALARRAGKSSDTLEWVRSLIRGPEAAKRDLGLYVLKHLQLADPSRDETAVFREAIHRGPFESGVATQLLIALTLNGRSTDPGLAQGVLEGAVWDFNREQTTDLRAARRFMGIDAGAPMEPGEERALAGLRSSAELRKDLMASGAVSGEPLLRGIVEGYYELPRRPEEIRRAQTALARSPELIRITRLLFGSPFWEIGEAAASVIAPLMSERPELGPLIGELLTHENWHLRYAACDAAYFGRRLDGGRLLEAALRSGHLDESAWVRGLCAGMLKGALITHPEDLVESAARVTPQVSALLKDRDILPLMEVGVLIHELERQGFDICGLLRGGVSPLLGEASEWSSLERWGLIDRIEARRRSSGYDVGQA